MLQSWIPKSTIWPLSFPILEVGTESIVAPSASQDLSFGTIPAREVLCTSAFCGLWKACRRRWHMSQRSVFHSRRFTSRVETPAGVWVDWCCAGREDISRVRNLSLGGLFVETPKSREVGSTAKLEFLVQEGQIRADAVVRRAEPGRGLAMKFTAVSAEDRPRLETLISRLRYSS
jgi:hypothetical protein